MKTKERKPILSVTKKDCRWDYYVGSGKGGQKRNRTSNCVRCTHIDSGAQFQERCCRLALQFFWEGRINEQGTRI